MRKFFNCLAAVALAVAASASMAACSDDDIDDPEPTEKTMKQAEVTACLYVNQAMLDTYDIVGTADGKELSVAARPVDVTLSDLSVASLYPMQYTATSTKLPMTAEMNVTFTVKEGYNVPEKNDFVIATRANGVIVYDNGDSEEYAKSGYTLQNNGVMGEKIEGYTATLNKNFGTIKYTLTTAGLTAAE